MGIKTTADNIRLSERLRLDNLSTPIDPLLLPTGSIVQCATSRSGSATNITSNFSDWTAIAATECSIVPRVDDSLLLYQSSINVEYDSGDQISNIYYFLKVYRSIPTSMQTDAHTWTAISGSKQYGHAGADLGGATGKFLFTFLDDTWDFKAGHRVHYKVYFHAMNTSDNQSIHFNQPLTDTDGGGQNYYSQNTIMEIKRS